MGYKVVMHRNIEQFQKACDDLVAEGYTPCGGMAINSDRQELFQAFFREESSRRSKRSTKTTTK